MKGSSSEGLSVDYLPYIKSLCAVFTSPVSKEATRSNIHIPYFIHAAKTNPQTQTPQPYNNRWMASHNVIIHDQKSGVAKNNEKQASATTY